MNNKLLSLLRQRATRIDHTVITQRVCVYCGGPVAPHRDPNGKTYNLDHFIPVRELEIARRRHPLLHLPNWLLPCCSTCNLIAQGYVFATFQTKFDFVQSRQRSKAKWQIPDNPLAAELSELTVNLDFRSIIVPLDENLSERRAIYCPERDFYDNLWRITQKMIPLCSSKIPFSGR
jgi:hypothetical protein